MSNFSTSWKSSKKPKKQRKFLLNAPLHVRSKFLRAHLSDELIKKIGKKTLRVRKEDKVKVMKGQFKGIVGKVERVDTKKSKVYITGVEIQKKDGTKVKYPIHVSNIMITELYTSDKQRIKKD
ncbi:MAG: 50S ribosomal protein L24 [Candidatus Woesearchaeota archaeon]